MAQNKIKNRDFERVTKAILFLKSHAAEKPSLKELSQFLGLSEFHCQRLFKKWAGISPKNFVQFISLARAKALLPHRSLLDTSLEIGLSGPSRLHDLFIRYEAMSPGEYKAGAKGIEINWATVNSPLGSMAIAETRRGLCYLSFGESGNLTLQNLRKNWPKAKISKNEKAIQDSGHHVSRQILGQSTKRIQLILKGTPFQVKVWEALLRIPRGHVLSYQQLATHCGKPNATRAVASAIAANPIGFLIPCHRVIRSSGIIGDYRWGTNRKTALLAIEHSRKKIKTHSQ